MRNRPTTNRSYGRSKIASVLAVALVLVVAVAIVYFVSPSNRDSPATTQAAATKAEQPTPAYTSATTLKLRPELDDDDTDLYLDREMQAQVLQVADMYEESSKYPVYSVPVVGERFAEPVQPFEEAEVDSVYPKNQDDLGNPLRVAASVERLRYFEGEQITARLMVSGGTVVDFSQVNATGSIIAVDDGRNIGLATVFEPLGGAGFEFRAVFDTRSLAPGSMPRQAMVKANVFVDGESVAVQTVPFFYSDRTAALLENVMPAMQDGAVMKIPLEYSVQQPGYYFVDAFLDDASTGQALLQLKTEGPMQQGNDVLVLNAHIAALKDAGSEGPYRLRVVKSFLAGVPGQSSDLPARISQQEGYYLEGIPFAQYDDTPYFDPEVQERIDFLREVGNSTTPESASVAEQAPIEEL